jgi:hypothetical protein
MPRFYIVRPLIRKELLRYRYNWGLLVVVFALLALSALVAASSHFKGLPGVNDEEIKACKIFYTPRAAEWAQRLNASRPDFACTLSFHPITAPLAQSGPPLTPGEVAIELSSEPAMAAPPALKGGPVAEARIPTIRYWNADELATGMARVREWARGVSDAHWHATPAIHEKSSRAAAELGSSVVERLPLVVASLAIFAMYLLSFNLFITSTGEEREKRVLLGLLLSPASPTEVLIAKALFYATSSLAVAMAVVGMYQPRLLLQPALWLTVVSGSVCYVAIGTIAVSIVRRQTTINTVSMLYLISTSIVMILAQFLPPFKVLQALLVENYLYSQMKLLIAGQSHWWMGQTQVVLAGLTGLWCLAALWVFDRNATSMARAR